MPENSLNAISWNDDETEAVVAEAECNSSFSVAGAAFTASIF